MLQLREKRLPVHRSGPNDDKVNLAIYVITALTMTYVMVLFVDVIRKS